MKMTPETYERQVELNGGYCLVCNKITRYKTEPDAIRYGCPDCNGETVMGIEAALIEGHIEMVDSDEEMDDSYDYEDL